jgi:hypothetical protein
VTDGEKWKDLFSTGQSPQWAVVPVDEEEEEEEYCNLYPIFVRNLCNMTLVLCHQMADSLLRVKALPFRALLLFNS